MVHALRSKKVRITENIRDKKFFIEIKRDKCPTRELMTSSSIMNEEGRRILSAVAGEQLELYQLQQRPSRARLSGNRIWYTATTESLKECELTNIQVSLRKLGSEEDSRSIDESWIGRRVFVGLGTTGDYVNFGRVTILNFKYVDGEPSIEFMIDGETRGTYHNELKFKDVAFYLEDELRKTMYLYY